MKDAEKKKPKLEDLIEQVPGPESEAAFLEFGVKLMGELVYIDDASAEEKMRIKLQAGAWTGHALSRAKLIRKRKRDHDASRDY